jgi:acyl dehydratase
MVGMVLPELSVQLDTVHLFMFSAVTWNRHLIHFDGDQARREGHQAVVAQRGLLGNYFARQVTSWLDGGARLSGLTWKVIRGSVPGDVLTCRAAVTGVADGETIIDQELVNQHGDTVATATATVLVNAPVPGAEPEHDRAAGAETSR